MSQNYKDTINLPRTDFPMKANLAQREPELLNRWEETGVYRQIQKSRENAELFVLHDGPPFANGDVHMGTALNKILKDFVVKSQTMLGKRAPYVPGWDCHGLPIEYKVVKESRDLAPLEVRKRCEAFARKFIDLQRQQFKRLGVFGDWDHPYLTMDPAYEAEILRAYFSDGGKWKVRIDYSLESEPLGTMGPLKLIPDLPETFLVLNGDILTDLNYAEFVRSHANEGALFTISAAAREQKIDFGVLDVGEDHMLRGFHEKPSVRYLVSMGIYCMNRRVLDWIPEGRPFGFDHLVLALLARGQPIRTVTHAGYWLDIGRPDDYEKAIEDWPALSVSMGL